MPADPFAARPDTVIAPARAPYAVTPHDVNELPITPRALFVGTGGTLVLSGIDASSDVTLRNVASGQVLDIRARFVRATGTTAADIVALV